MHTHDNADEIRRTTDGHSQCVSGIGSGAYAVTVDGGPAPMMTAPVVLCEGESGEQTVVPGDVANAVPEDKLLKGLVYSDNPNAQATMQEFTGVTMLLSSHDRDRDGGPESVPCALGDVYPYDDDVHGVRRVSRGVLVANDLQIGKVDSFVDMMDLLQRQLGPILDAEIERVRVARAAGDDTAVFNILVAFFDLPAYKNARAVLDALAKLDAKWLLVWPELGGEHCMWAVMSAPLVQLSAGHLKRLYATLHDGRADAVNNKVVGKSNKRVLIDYLTVDHHLASRVLLDRWAASSAENAALRNQALVMLPRVLAGEQGDVRASFLAKAKTIAARVEAWAGAETSEFKDCQFADIAHLVLRSGPAALGLYFGQRANWPVLHEASACLAQETLCGTSSAEYAKTLAVWHHRFLLLSDDNQRALRALRAISATGNAFSAMCPEGRQEGDVILPIKHGVTGLVVADLVNYESLLRTAHQRYTVAQDVLRPRRVSLDEDLSATSADHQATTGGTRCAVRRRKLRRDLLARGAPALTEADVTASAENEGVYRCRGMRARHLTPGQIDDHLRRAAKCADRARELAVAVVQRRKLPVLHALACQRMRDPARRARNVVNPRQLLAYIAKHIAAGSVGEYVGMLVHANTGKPLPHNKAAQFKSLTAFLPGAVYRTVPSYTISASPTAGPAPDGPPGRIAAHKCIKTADVMAVYYTVLPKCKTVGELCVKLWAALRRFLCGVDTETLLLLAFDVLRPLLKVLLTEGGRTPLCDDTVVTVDVTATTSLNDKNAKALFLRSERQRQIFFAFFFEWIAEQMEAGTLPGSPCGVFFTGLLAVRGVPDARGDIFGLLMTGPDAVHRFRLPGAVPRVVLEGENHMLHGIVALLAADEPELVRMLTDGPVSVLAFTEDTDAKVLFTVAHETGQLPRASSLYVVSTARERGSKVTDRKVWDVVPAVAWYRDHLLEHNVDLPLGLSRLLLHAAGFGMNDSVLAIAKRGAATMAKLALRWPDLLAAAYPAVPVPGRPGACTISVDADAWLRLYAVCEASRFADFRGDPRAVLVAAENGVTRDKSLEEVFCLLHLTAVQSVKDKATNVCMTAQVARSVVQLVRTAVRALQGGDPDDCAVLVATTDDGRTAPAGTPLTAENAAIELLPGVLLQADGILRPEFQETQLGPEPEHGEDDVVVDVEGDDEGSDEDGEEDCDGEEGSDGEGDGQEV